MAELCGANAKSTGLPCTRPVVRGANRCRFHGGASPQVKAAAARRVQIQQAEQAVATFGLSREVDPRDALLEEVYRTAGAVDWLHQKVQALDADDVIWGKTEEVNKGSGEFAGLDVTHAATVNMWVKLYQDERAHLVKVCKDAISCGIEERKVRLAEQQGAMLAGVIKAILGDLDLTPDQQAKVATVVPFRLRSVTAAV